MAVAKRTLDELDERGWLRLFLGHLADKPFAFPRLLLDHVAWQIRAETKRSNGPKTLREWSFRSDTRHLYSETLEEAVKEALSLKNCVVDADDQFQIQKPNELKRMKEETLELLTAADRALAMRWAGKFRQFLLDECERRGITHSL